MALDRTGGFDLLIQMSESEINNQIATAFLAGTIFPMTMNFPITSSGFAGSADIIFGTPRINLDPSPQVELIIPFANSQLNITSPIPLTISPIGGEIRILDTIQVERELGSNKIVMDFLNGAPIVTFTFDTSSAGLLSPLLTAAGLTLTQAQNTIAGMILAKLQSEILAFPLSPDISVADDSDPTTIFNFDVNTFNDTSALDRDCLNIGVRMSSASGGNINTVSNNFMPSGVNSMVMMSNFWLLAHVIRPRMATSLGLSLSDIDTPFRLNRPVAAPGGEGTLTRLEARVDGNRIRVDGSASASGTGWSATSNFHFFIELGLSSGSLTVTSTTPIVDTDVDLEWWVWLASAFLGGLFGGIIGAIVGVIVTAIVEAIAEGIVNNMVSDGISGGIGAIPAIPLGPIGGGFTINNILLDDLELRCSILKNIEIPIKSQGQIEKNSMFGIDLETGRIRNVPNRETDLIFDPQRGILTANTAGLTVLNANFNSLSPVDLSSYPHTRTTIPYNQIPQSFPSGIWFLPHHEIVFGIRTAEGRLGKVKAFINVQNQNINMEWVIFDTPIPSLEIEQKWVTLEKGEVKQYITDDCQFCTSTETKWRGVFTAKSKLLAFPINYQWCYCGEVLKDSEGVLEQNGEKLQYKIVGNKLYLDATRINQNIECKVCLSAIDNKGREFFKCINLKQNGLNIKCRKCGDKPKLIDYIDTTLVMTAAFNRPLELTKYLVKQ